jgi:hypothetical protein
MATYQTISGATVKIFLGGVLYPEAQSISYMIDYGEDAIYGVDSGFAQEIRQTRVSVKGSITGIRIKASGGIQSRNARTLIKEALHAPYVSIQIKDRSTDEIILFVAQTKITNESFSVSAKGIVSVSFNFTGIIPMGSNDLS